MGRDGQNISPKLGEEKRQRLPHTTRAVIQSLRRDPESLTVSVMCRLQMFKNGLTTQLFNLIVIPILRDARKTLDSANAVLSSDAPVQTELRDTLREVGRAAAAVRNLADLLEQQPQSLLTGKKASQ